MTRMGEREGGRKEGGSGSGGRSGDASRPRVFPVSVRRGVLFIEADRGRTGEMTGARAGVSPAAAVRVRVRVRPARERGRIEVQVRRCAACGEDGREWVVDFGCVEVEARAWA